MDELMDEDKSEQEDSEEEEGEDVWQPKKLEKGRRGSKKPKATGVRLSPTH